MGHDGKDVKLVDRVEAMELRPTNKHQCTNINKLQEPPLVWQLIHHPAIVPVCARDEHGCSLDQARHPAVVEVHREPEEMTAQSTSCVETVWRFSIAMSRGRKLNKPLTF